MLGWGFGACVPDMVYVVDGSSLGLSVFFPTAYFMNEKRIILSRSTLRVWMGSSSLFVLSAVSGFNHSLGPSAGIPRLRSLLLPLFLSPGRFLSLLVSPRIGSRPVEGGLGFPFL